MQQNVESRQRRGRKLRLEGGQRSLVGTRQVCKAQKNMSKVALGRHPIPEMNAAELSGCQVLKTFAKEGGIACRPPLVTHPPWRERSNADVVFSYKRSSNVYARSHSYGSRMLARGCWITRSRHVARSEPLASDPDSFSCVCVCMCVCACVCVRLHLCVCVCVCLWVFIPRLGLPDSRRK